MEDRRAAVAERREQIGDAPYRLRIVAPLAGGLPLVEGTLHVDDDEGGGGLRIGHEGVFSGSLSRREYALASAALKTPFLPRFPTRRYAFRRNHTPKAITTANASVNQVMAYCRWSSLRWTCSGPGFGTPFCGAGDSRSM